AGVNGSRPHSPSGRADAGDRTRVSSARAADGRIGDDAATVPNARICCVVRAGRPRRAVLVVLHQLWRPNGAGQVEGRHAAFETNRQRTASRCRTCRGVGDHARLARAVWRDPRLCGSETRAWMIEAPNPRTRLYTTASM